MGEVLNFYLDDSGTRYPNRRQGTTAAHGYDWFALGGVLVRDEEESAARQLHADFCNNWSITVPLHSAEIRSQNESFLWLRGLSDDDRKRFYEELYQLLKNAPTTGLACVIDRPGYNGRYSQMYQAEPWLLCKTAFCVAVERAAKFARSSDCRLRVAPERCNRTEDRLMAGYYDSLKVDGMPFAEETSGKYGPLAPEQFVETLYEFRPKAKSSPMAQFADLYLWPICMGGYNANNRPFRRLKEDGKLIECHLAEADWPTLATKYSCFDSVGQQT